MNLNVMRLLAVALSAALALMAFSGAAAQQDPAPIRAPITVEKIDFQDGKLIISGYQGDGCPYPIQIANQPQPAPDALVLDLYREIPANVFCTAVITPVTVEIPVKDGPKLLAVEANGFVALFEEGRAIPVAADAIGVDRFRVVKDADSPSGYALEMTIIVDGCDFPYLVRQTRPSDTVTQIVVGRAIRPNAACTMIARYLPLRVPLLEKGAGLTLFRVNSQAAFFNFR
jgi:hypothetical protein